MFWPPPPGTVLLTKLGKHGRIQHVFAEFSSNVGDKYEIIVTEHGYHIMAHVHSVVHTMERKDGAGEDLQHKDDAGEVLQDAVAGPENSDRDFWESFAQGVKESL